MKSLPESIQEVIGHAPPPSLQAGQPNPELTDKIEAFQPHSLFPDSADIDSDFAKCCLAGLYLKNNQLDPAHTLSQQVEIQEGAFWHGIIHRREGDSGNAKYWLGRVGKHPVMEKLKAEFGDFYASPSDFVDACAQASESSEPSTEQCLEIQKTEWELLFQHCYWSASSAQGLE